MTLVPGTRLGPYEIVAPLGAGGMGEVWRARDPRLGRDVAIKALPAAFAADAERLARFEREARLLASLNHANVAGIHAVEDVAGTRYLVLEFVDGETLEKRLSRGALPLDEALDVARQVAAGVEAAHEAGIVHRDLKPGNVMLAPGGAVKVLDFGLARGGANEGTGSNPNLSASPTMTYAATQAGVILGTAAYMSPEQARGRAVDRRTDIWSFGCVLFEMLSGQRAYDGETVSDMVARILEREPDWSALPASVPPRLTALMKRCLTKDAKQRQRDIGDARLELEAIAAGDRGEGAAAAAPAKRKRSPAFEIGVAILASLAGVVATKLVTRPAPEQPMTLSLQPPAGLVLGVEESALALSHDGRMLAFVASDSSSGPRLWIRGLDHENSRPLENTAGAEMPFWSPDDRRLGFFADGKLKTVALASGAVRTLAEAPLPRGGSWGRGVILFQPRSLGPLWSVPEGGGAPTPVTVVDTVAGDEGHRFPQFFPDGRHYAATILGKLDNRAALGVLGRSDLKPLFLVTGSAGATLVAPHWLIGPREGTMQAQRVDPRARVTRGPALEVPGLKAISPYSNGSPILTASATGLLVQGTSINRLQRLSLVGREGRTIRDYDSPRGQFSRGNISPDGRRVALEFVRNASEDAHVWMLDLERGGFQPYTFEDQNFTPVFSPDGRVLALNREVKGSRQDLWTLRADAPGALQRVRRMEGRFQSALGWSPDGRGVLMRTQGTDTRQDLVYVSWGDTVRSVTVLGSRFNEPVGAISPDGRWLAYVSDESGQYECRVRAFPTAEGQVVVVSRGAYADPTASTRIGQPVWRRDGRELLYCAADGRTLTVVPVTPGAPPAFGEPRALFRLPATVTDIAVSADLDRILLSLTREEEVRVGLTVISHWTGLLDDSK